ncbi:hypothetical protein Pelo_8259 [Pelomyxa schiedti]|nr:hypothetical protein Pelo_8259 [Pelomyxa schiedti]
MGFIEKVVVSLAVWVVVVQCNRLMPWMCLERCGHTPDDILDQLKSLYDHRDVVSTVSFELYNLGPNGTIVRNNLTDVNDILASWGFETLPMFSSYPYPPEFLDWMRYLFANPDHFINEAVANAVIYGHSGYNMDFEPTTTATDQDAIDYANFLTQFADALHLKGKVLSVDVATWNTIWNYELIAQSHVDYINCMATYTGSWDSFQKQLALAVSEIGTEKLGIGMETVNTQNDQPLTDDEIEERFNLCEANGVHEVDIWEMPIYDNWWPYITQFMS